MVALISAWPVALLVVGVLPLLGIVFWANCEG
jgi:hypothetical protein